jgi:hypothetical protein
MKERPTLKAPDNVTRWASVVHKNKHPEVSAELVLAIIWQESAGDRWAFRYEPEYRYFFDYKRRLPLFSKAKSMEENRRFALSILGPTEFHAQSASFGLMQIMGAVARERSFKSSILELGDPECNIVYATMHLWVYGYKNGSLSTEEALKRYNGGEVYAGQVLDKLVIIQSR